MVHGPCSYIVDSRSSFMKLPTLVGRYLPRCDGLVTTYRGAGATGRGAGPGPYKLGRYPTW